MKLSRQDLIRAQDKQLETIGVTRKKNAGWLKDTLAREFTPAEVKMFHSARRSTKTDVAACRITSPSIAERSAMLETALGFILHYGERSGWSRVRQVCEMALSGTDPSEVLRDEEEAEKEFVNTFAPTVEPNPNCACAACNPRAWWMVVCPTCGNKRCPHAENHEFICSGSNEPGQVGRLFRPNGGISPEDFANQLFAENGGELG